MSKTISPPSSPSRVSVPVSAEVHEAFQRLAKASNMSTGRAIAEWLADTVEAAQFMALKVEQARAAPRIVMQELHAYALGMADETGALLDKVREKGREGAGGMPKAHAGARTAQSPPSCNTGGKLLNQGKRTRGGKSS